MDVEKKRKKTEGSQEKYVFLFLQSRIFVISPWSLFKERERSFLLSIGREIDR